MHEQPTDATGAVGAARARLADDAGDRRYRELFESAPVGIFVSRPDGTLASCNPAFARMFGFASVAEAISSNTTILQTSPDRGGALLQRVREQRQVEYRGPMRRRDGSTIEVMTTAIGAFDTAGALLEMHGFVFDITASAEADAALAERERRFRSVFVDAADPMLVLNANRGIVDANRAACALFGLAEDALTARSLDDLVLDDAAQFASTWRELLALGEAKREHRVKSEGRGPRLVESSYRAAVESHHYLWIARDVTDRRLLEERLVQSEKIESIGRLAGGIAHDFNNLLTAILGYTELLLSSRGFDDPHRADLEQIQKAGQRAAALTQQLLAYSRKQVLQPKEVDLNETISNLRVMLSRLIREDTTLTCELAPAPAFVKIDPTQLEQVILNLVLNARDALPTGGSIRLEVARVELTTVDLPSDQAVPANQYIRLRVVDDGEGIKPDARAHLFEPFFTTKERGKGTGLGLASVYGIVRQSNGFIGVESEPGRGTTFTMHFPAVGRAPIQAYDEPSAPSRARGTILLVEDDDAVRAIAGAVLRRQGYEILEASTPLAACELFDQRAGQIDLLLTDVIMPEMNGPALAQRLVAARPELRVLFISGYADVASPFDTDNPNIGFLSKPFHASGLTAKVHAALSRPHPSLLGGHDGADPS